VIPGTTGLKVWLEMTQQLVLKENRNSGKSEAILLVRNLQDLMAHPGAKGDTRNNRSSRRMEMTQQLVPKEKQGYKEPGIRGDTGSARNAGLDGRARPKVIQEQIGISGRVAGNDGALVLKEKQEYKESRNQEDWLRKIAGLMERTGDTGATGLAQLE
jgi:hypothetical protein